MKHLKMQKLFKMAGSYLLVICAACTMALNYYLLILPNAFAPAGINGICTMLQYSFGISISNMSLYINVPLAIFGLYYIDKGYTLKSLVFVVTFSMGLRLLQAGTPDISAFIYLTQDGKSTILAPIAAGALNGLIYGAAVLAGGSTGGTDFIASFIHKKRPEYSMMRVLFVLNALVAAASYFVYGYNIEPVILCIIYSYITTGVSDGIIRGGRSALKIEMITEHPQEVTKALINGLRHSVTVVPAIGGYTGQQKNMLICVVNKHQIRQFTEIISKYPDTFACISDVTNTIGNFKRIRR